MKMRLVVLARHAVEAVEVEEVDELVVVDELLLALRQPLGDLIGEALLPRHELGVSLIRIMQFQLRRSTR